MPSLAEVLLQRVEQLQRRIDGMTGVFEVATTAPSFTVYLNGGDVAVAALKVAGESYSVGTKGRYFLDQGQKPLCIPTA